MKYDLLVHAFPGWITNLLALKWLILSSTFLVLVILAGFSLMIFLRRNTKPKKKAVSLERKKHTLNYENIITIIKERNNRIQSILLAANSLNDLPVTVPINVGIGLAETHKCLLVDLDIKRNAIARVFDIEAATGNTFKAGSCPTPIENLYVWPARNFELLRQTNLRSLLEGAVKKYDYVLLYAPYLTTLPDRRQVASCAKQVIIFGGKDNSRLMELLEQCDCKVIEEISSQYTYNNDAAS